MVKKKQLAALIDDLYISYDAAVEEIVSLKKRVYDLETGGITRETSAGDERWDIITNPDAYERTFKNIEAEREEAEATESLRYDGETVLTKAGRYFSEAAERSRMDDNGGRLPDEEGA